MGSLLTQICWKLDCAICGVTRKQVDILPNLLTLICWKLDCAICGLTRKQKAFYQIPAYVLYTSIIDPRDLPNGLEPGVRL